jgi:hypothetical protein
MGYETEREKMKIINIKKVKLSKGDVLFFELTKEYPKPVIEQYFQQLKDFFPDQDIVVLPKGVSLKKITHNKEDK